MSTTFESLVMVDGAEANRILQSIDEQGEEAVFANLCSNFEPGSGTLITTRSEPWSAAEHIYANGEFVMYYDNRKETVGLVCVLN